MQKTILITLALAVAVCAGAKTPKKKRTLPVKVQTEKVPEAVDGERFSYALGVAQSESLKQYLVQRLGVDSAYVPVAAKAIKEAESLSEAEVKERVAYAAGLSIAKMNKESVIPSLNQGATGKSDTTYASLPAFTSGLVDGMNGIATLSADSAQKVAEQQFEYYKYTLKKANTDWLAANAKNKDVKSTPSGLQYRVIKQGTGAVATDTTQVEVNYEGKLIDGTIFDSSYKRGKTATFTPTQVIKGWGEALKMMPEGSIYELFIPYDLGYGERGAGRDIPPYATLIFKVEIVKVPAVAKK